MYVYVCRVVAIYTVMFYVLFLNTRNSNPCTLYVQYFRNPGNVAKKCKSMPPRSLAIMHAFSCTCNFIFRRYSLGVWKRLIVINPRRACAARVTVVVLCVLFISSVCVYNLPNLSLPCRLLPYGALSTGNRVGFIEVVRKSETIANIQKLEKANAGKRIGLWDSSLLYTWLKKKNVVEQQ